MANRLAQGIAVWLFLSVFSSMASAQDLADVARASRANRMKVMQDRSVRIWTNDNIPKAPAAGPTAATGMAAVPPPPSEADALPASEMSGAPASAASADADKQKTREYWQQRFKSVKQRLDDMLEQQRLAEDELSLLQVQQARELSPSIRSQLAAKVKAASAEAEAKRLETAKVRKELEELEKEFEESGAPPDWKKTD